MKKTNDNLSVTVGADPELMLYSVDKKKIVSSIPVLKRDKHNPIDLGDGIKMYADNVLVETAFAPSVSKAEFMGTIKTVLTRMQERLGDKFRLLAKTAHVYDADELKDEAAWLTGCSPNFDAYGLTQNLPADFKNGLRTGSFHIHLGNADFKKKVNNGKLLTFDSKINAIKVLDIILGCSSVIFDGDKSSDMRRALYGKAGEHRPTPYGVEWRVLGNFPLRSPVTTELVLDLTHHALSFIKEGTEIDLINSVDANLVTKAINNNDKASARKVIAKVGLPDALLKRINQKHDFELYTAWGL